jgi:hypothetical protein
MASRFRRRRRCLEEGPHIGGDLKAIIWRAVSEISAQKLKEFLIICLPGVRYVLSASYSIQAVNVDSLSGSRLLWYILDIFAY